MIEQGLIERVNQRTQRRFHKAVVAGVVTTDAAPETRLWRQSERLMDRLIVEAQWAESMAEWTRLQAEDPEAPDYAEQMDEYLGSRCCGADERTPHWVRCPERWTEGELRLAAGDR